jgi:hypothetical protein
MRPTQRFALPLRVAAALYDATANVLWSALAFVPVIFCYRFMARAWLWAFVAASLIGFVMPASMLKRLQLSSTAKAYRRLGVHWANYFVQHGVLINRLLRQSHPEYQRVNSRASLASLRQSTYMQERFHWTVLLFFLQSSLYAIARGCPGWALLITGLNLVYNLYPIWLQQYIRVRLNRAHSASIPPAQPV